MNWPLAVACLAFLLGMGLIVAGTYVLAGLGWALLAGSGSCFLLGFVILRGLRGQ
jgi:hypothetical protein